MALALVLFFGLAFADTYISATPIAAQDRPYDSQPLVGSTATGAQDTVYENQPVSGSVSTGAQDTVYDLQAVATTVQIFDQNAQIPVVDYNAVYNPDTNTTTVQVSVTSDPVPTYYVFIYSPAGKLLKSYSSSSATSSTSINGEYYILYIVVIANSIGTAGMMDIGIAPEFVVGTNIIPIYLTDVGEFDITVFGGYALSPVYVNDTNTPVYVIAVKKVVEVYVG